MRWKNAHIWRVALMSCVAEVQPLKQPAGARLPSRTRVVSDMGRQREGRDPDRARTRPRVHAAVHGAQRHFAAVVAGRPGVAPRRAVAEGLL